MVRRVLALGVLFLLVGCTTRGCGKVTPPKDDNTVTIPKTTNGLEGAEQARFRHLAEGSELYPLAWILALEQPKSDKPFLENPQRFGLLPDVKSDENPYGLPVGMTADYTRDLRFARVRMIGINCAGCHVNELHYKGEAVVRIDGAPNLFDLELFLGELAAASQETLQDAGKAWRFFRRLYEVFNPSSGNAIVARLAKPADTVLSSYDSLATMKKGTLGKALADKLEEAHKAAIALPADDLNKGLVVSPPKKGAALDEYLGSVKKKSEVKLSLALRKEAKELRRKSLSFPELKIEPAELAKVKPTRTTPLSKLDASERATSIGDAVEDFIETIRLLKARVAFLADLANRGSLAHTPPGYGRVDAFGSARNRFFPTDKKPTTAPISYPHLWELKTVDWLHWDANTTSVLERNAGQAIGLGALFDPNTFESTILVDNLVTLEALARKIEPPAWPAKFPKIDKAKAERGQKLFAKHCFDCHQPGKGSEKDDDLRPLKEIGTDDTRANNFAMDADGKKFDVALSEVLKKLVRQAGGTTPDAKLWRLTKQYPNRPLRAIWATAPYLHNNSVPTLYDLLLPASDRPPTFSVGSREYDPVKLGYSDKEGLPKFDFDTSKTGNGNKGHEYGTTMSKDERMELLEYLKTL